MLEKAAYYVLVFALCTISILWISMIWGVTPEVWMWKTCQTLFSIGLTLGAISLIRRHLIIETKDAIKSD